MAAKKIITVGLKSVKYATPSQSGLPTFTDSIDVVHQDTFSYEMSEATRQEYINALTGKAYYIEQTEAPTESINFSIGQYTLEDKAKFMGGTASPATASENEKWTPGTGEPIYMAIQVVTKDNVQITYPYASISATHGQNINALGINVIAEPVEHPDGTTPAVIWEVLGTKTA